jgi:CPA2 family monovalent cation:H+ antiporter-2
MPHDTALISTIAAGLAFAFVGGLLAQRAGLPPLVGYLLAGVAVEPFTPGYVADPGLAGQLAEIGVILLMFGVGMHFSLRDLLAVWRIAVPGAIAQIATAMALGTGLALLWGWPLGAGLVFGLALSVASTVVLLRALEGRGAVRTEDGRIAIGWLIVEDLVMVLVLVLLPSLASSLGGQPADPANAPSGSVAAVVGTAMLKVAAFLVVMLVGGARLFPWLPDLASCSHWR